MAAVLEVLAGPFASAILLICTLTGVSGCSELNRELTLVEPRLGIDQEIARAFALQLDQEASLRIVLVENPDPSLPGLAAVKSGQADLALVPNTERYDPAVATVVPLYPTVLHIAYRVTGDAPDQDELDLIARLTENSVFAGPPGSASRLLLETAVRRDGLDPARIRYVSDEDACADVIVVYAPIRPGMPERLGDCGAYRLLSLGAPEDVGTGAAIDAITLRSPHLKPFVIPAGTYGDLNPGPVLTLAVDKLLVVRADAPDSLIYDLLQEILRLKPALSANQPGLFHQLTDDFDVSGSAFVLHPGAMDYLRRDEPDIYERYSGVAEVLVSLIIGLVSGIYAIYRLLMIRRKNRIDAFCRQALDLRDEALAVGTDQARVTAVDDLRDLQERAYAEMIAERLAADESFRIFITLTNDLMADLRGHPRPRSV